MYNYINISYKNKGVNAMKKKSVTSLFIFALSMSVSVGNISVANATEALNYNNMEEYVYYQDTISALAETGATTRYALCDLDKDGLRELLVSYGTSMADWNNSVFMLYEGTPISVCSFYGASSFYEAEDGNGIYAVYASKNYYQEVRRVSKVGAQIGIEPIQVGYLSGEEEFFKNNFEISLMTYGDITSASENTGNSDVNFTVNYGGTGETEGYVFPESSAFEFQGTIENAPAWIYQYGINEIYAKHGYVFSNQDVQNLFSWKSWYYPNYNFSEMDITSIEQQNISYFNNCIAASGEDAGFGLPSNAPSY